MMKTEKLVMIGATGHLQSVMDSALAMERYEIAAIVDDDAPLDRTYFGMPVTGRTSLLKELLDSGVRKAFVSAGSIGGYGQRLRLHDLALSLGFTLVSIIDPTAALARNAELGANVFIGKNAVVNAYAQLGDMTIVNTGAVVEHADILAPYANIAPGCTLSGAVQVGRAAHLGTGSSVRQEIRIGEGALIGVGSAVVHDIPPFCVAYGNPCEVREKLPRAHG